MRKPMGRKQVLQGTAAKRSEDIIKSDNEIWQSLYVLTGHWQSDFRFINDELRFLTSLIDKYFMKLIADSNIDNTKKVAAMLIGLEKQRLVCEQKITEHLHHLSGLIESPFAHDAQEYKDEHAGLEKTIAEFMKDFRETKSAVFTLTEDIIGSEKAKHLLGGG